MASPKLSSSNFSSEYESFNNMIYSEEKTISQNIDNNILKLIIILLLIILIIYILYYILKK